MKDVLKDFVKLGWLVWIAGVSLFVEAQAGEIAGIFTLTQKGIEITSDLSMAAVIIGPLVVLVSSGILKIMEKRAK